MVGLWQDGRGRMLDRSDDEYSANRRMWTLVLNNSGVSLPNVTNEVHDELDILFDAPWYLIDDTGDSIVVRHIDGAKVVKVVEYTICEDGYYL